MAHPAPMRERSPITEPAPITACARDERRLRHARRWIDDGSGMDARKRGCAPDTDSGITAASAARGSRTRINVRPRGKSNGAPEIPMAPEDIRAFESPAAASALRFPTNAKSVGDAASKGATAEISRSGSPSHAAFKTSAISFTRKTPSPATCRSSPLYHTNLCRLILRLPSHQPRACIRTRQWGRRR